MIEIVKENENGMEMYECAMPRGVGGAKEVGDGYDSCIE